MLLEMKNNINEAHQGLSTEEVEKRIRNKQTNKSVKPPSKSVPEIIFGNIFTYFNLIFAILAILLALVQSYRDMTFLIIIVANTLIGIVQELRSKSVLDKMNMLSAPYALVVRNGEENLIMAEDLVKDDVVNFNAGDQICADAVVLEGESYVNESLLTGEQDEISKKPGDRLMSGSFVVSGNCYARLTEVGEESYISKLTIEAKKMRTGEQSEMIRSLNKIVKLAGIAIIPIGLILFVQQFWLSGLPIKESVQAMVAAVIGMIPEGLFLLASVTLAISAMKLAKNKVLLHEMKSIETLARVDVLCVDKTGTITDTEMKVTELIQLDGFNKSKDELKQLISDFTSAQKADNITMQAMKDYFKDKVQLKPVSVSGFSSQYKYSGVQFENESYVLGAPEFILRDMYNQYKEDIEKYSKRGQRVLAFCKYEGILDGKELTEKVTPCGLILIENPIRENAVGTFKYFNEQGVEIKVISGDNPITVSEVAKKAKIKNAGKYIDASKLETDEEIEDAVAKYTVFGRVTPQQKRKFVQALKKQGRTVAMTGDGVNDVLALKSSDCSIAMANGSDATRNVSQLVLLDSNFNSMPKVVAEGRRSINNIQRSASLFLVKTIYSTILALMFLFMGSSYPFVPVQLSLISVVTIGIPSFILALEPNNEKISGHFLKNIIANSLSTGIAIILNIFVLTLLHKYNIISNEYFSTLCIISTGTCGLLLLFTLAKKRKNEDSKLPFSIFRLLLAICLTFIFIFGLKYLDWWFNIAPLSPIMDLLFRIILQAAINFFIIYIVIKKILTMTK
ncbi:MAG: HAD-IC family P-type ATPase [Clostridia bacterium]|nr:HAD-IC family P-type ATPase [Clostridia bacterium]